MKKYFIIIVCLNILILQNTYCQINNGLNKKLIVKTNVLNILANKPTLTLERIINNKSSIEISFIQGEFKNKLYTDYYGFNGFILRGKSFYNNIKIKGINTYVGVYIGNLKRTIYREGVSIDNNGYITILSQAFSENSIRAGGTIGAMYFLSKKFVIDTQYSIGYGKYITNKKQTVPSKGYLDMQFACKIGYIF